MRKSCAWPGGTRPEPGLTASLDHCGLTVVPDTDDVIGCADVFVIGHVFRLLDVVNCDLTYFGKALFPLSRAWATRWRNI